MKGGTGTNAADCKQARSPCVTERPFLVNTRELSFARLTRHAGNAM
jgi:hypothetical protein